MATRSQHPPRYGSDGNATDAPSPLRLTGASQRMQVLVETNALLAALGFGARAFEDFDDLVASVSSMGVALYEKLFQFHLDDVVRTPQSSDDYVHNAQLVVNALRGALLDEPFATEQLTGESLCDGDVASIQQLITMFRHIHEILYTSESSGHAGEPTQEEEEAEEEEDSEKDGSRDMTTPPRRPRREEVMNAPQRKKRSDKSQPTQATTTPARATGGNRVVPVASARTTRPAQSTATVKKRTRHTTTQQTRGPTTGGRRKDEQLEQELLTTQRYGRYVPVPQRSTRRLEDKESAEDDFAESSVEMNENDLAVGETYFGGVSSVSGASGSAASIHFMEEEGEFAQNFSAIQSHSSPGTNSKDSPETDSTPDRSGRAEVKASVPRRKSTNQQEAAEEEDETTKSPVKKKLAQPRGRDAPKSKPTRDAASTSSPSRGSLYPLLPETARHDRSSKSYKEYMRYKVQLKDHLQELRQREYCQRQHLERAYRLGEHAATVERIRARRFEQELRLHRIAIGLDAKTQEEKQLRDAMQHMLQLEKQKLRDEHRTTASALRQIQRDHAEREQALETFYATQIQLVKEQTQRELSERETVEKAHRMASEQMIREMRRERERELMTLLKEKQHLAEVRQFRHATQLTQAIEKGTNISARQGDAFYAAAMKARQLRATASSEAIPSGKPTKRSTTTVKQAPKRTTRTTLSYRSGARTAVRV